MFCVKCGVELAESERKCPLCSTPVYFPELAEDRERTYPNVKDTREKVSPRGIYFIITFVFLISAVISFICDYNIGGGLSWSGYVIGALILSYVSLILPWWFTHPNPTIFVPCSFAAAALYVWYISFATEGDWYFGFALPIIGIVALIVSAVVILTHYLKRGYLYIWGGAFIATGLFSILIEFLANVTFSLPMTIVWGLYPAISLSLIGLMLIIIAIVKPFRESLKRIFSI